MTPCTWLGTTHPCNPSHYGLWVNLYFFTMSIYKHLIVFCTCYLFLQWNVGITLNGGPVGRAGWRAVLPNEKHELSKGCRAAQKSGPAGCTTGLDSGLHIKLGCGKGRSGGLRFSAARCTAFLCSPPARLSVFCAARLQFTFFIWKHGSPARPGRRPSN